MKSGMVAIVGRSNVGKSTILNTIVGSKVAITTPKPQTTRLPISGIITHPEGQAVLIDTPGVMQKARDQLTQKLLEYAKESLRGADAIMYVVDPTRSIGDEEKQAFKLIEHSDKPKLLVINKIDDHGSKNYIDYYRDLASKFDNYVEVSGMTGKNTDLIVKWIFEHLPEGEPMYPLHQFTNLDNKTWLAELIREKLYLRLREEVPYATHYKSMIIGRKGQGIKEIGQSVRNELEAVSGVKYYLELNVQTDKHWINHYE